MRHIDRMLTNRWLQVILVFSLLIFSVLSHLFVQNKDYYGDESISLIISNGFKINKNLKVDYKYEYLNYDRIKKIQQEKTLKDVLSATVDDNSNGLSYYATMFIFKNLMGDSTHKTFKVGSILFSILTTLTIYLLARSIWPENSLYGLMALFLVVTHFYLIKYGSFIRVYPMSTTIISACYGILYWYQKQIKLSVITQSLGLLALYLASLISLFAHIYALPVIGALGAHTFFVFLTNKDLKNYRNAAITLGISLVTFFTWLFTVGYHGYLNTLEISKYWKLKGDNNEVIQAGSYGISLTLDNLIYFHHTYVSHLFSLNFYFLESISNSVYFLTHLLVLVLTLALISYRCFLLFKETPWKSAIKTPFFQLFITFSGYIALSVVLLLKEGHTVASLIFSYRSFLIIPTLILLLTDVFCFFILNRNISFVFKIPCLLLPLLMSFSTIVYLTRDPFTFISHYEVPKMKKCERILDLYKKEKCIYGMREADVIEMVITLGEKTKGYRFYSHHADKPTWFTKFNNHSNEL